MSNDSTQVDVQAVINSLTNQISQQAQRIALLEAMIESIRAPKPAAQTESTDA